MNEIIHKQNRFSNKTFIASSLQRNTDKTLNTNCRNISELQVNNYFTKYIVKFCHYCMAYLTTLSSLYGISVK